MNLKDFIGIKIFGKVNVRGYCIKLFKVGGQYNCLQTVDSSGTFYVTIIEDDELKSVNSNNKYRSLTYLLDGVFSLDEDRIEDLEHELRNSSDENTLKY